MNGAAWLSRRSRRSGWVITALAGIAIGLGQAPFEWFGLLFVGFPVLFWQLQSCSGWKPAFRLGWLAGTAHFALVLNWIVEPFLVDVARHGWMAPFALLLMSGGLALFWAGGFAAAALMQRPMARLLGLATGLAVLEWVRGWIFTGFPWALTAYAWADTPVAQMAAYVGPFGVSLVVLALALAPGLGLRGLGVAVLGVGAIWWAGADRLAQPVPERATPVILRVVQPNAAQHLKWQPEMLPVFYRRLMSMTAEPSATPPDVVLWPEAAVPFQLDERPDLQADMAQAAGGAVLLTGIRRREMPNRWYNSAAVLGPDGAVLARHDKDHLVPFGEYVPFNDTLARLGVGGLAVGNAGGFTAGSDSRRLEIPGLPPLTVMICYEAIFPRELNRDEPRAEWMALVTNDAWFGRWTGPYQHLAQNRFRAIEQGLPMARAANTGVSAIIDARGRVLQSLPLNQEGWFDAALPSALPVTPYRRWGEVPFLGLAAVLCALALFLDRRSV